MGRVDPAEPSVPRSQGLQGTEEVIGHPLGRVGLAYVVRDGLTLILVLPLIQFDERTSEALLGVALELKTVLRGEKTYFGRMRISIGVDDGTPEAKGLSHTQTNIS